MRDSFRRAFRWLLVIWGLCPAVTLALGSNESDYDRLLALDSQAMPWTVDKVETFIQGWPDLPRLAAGKMLEEYGAPDEVSGNYLQWNGKGGWLHTTVYRDNNLAQRFGVLEQSVSYRVPIERWKALKTLSVGVSYDVTDATLVAGSESEEANKLALNVAVDVVRGRRDVEEARQFYSRILDLSLSGKSSRYTQSLLFKPTFTPIATRHR